jgi:hypothetical protein
MTDYVNRPGDGTPLSPSYQRYPGQMATPISQFPAEYVGALTGAIGQLDIQAAMVSTRHGTSRLKLKQDWRAHCSSAHSPTT